MAINNSKITKEAILQKSLTRSTMTKYEEIEHINLSISPRNKRIPKRMNHHTTTFLLSGDYDSNKVISLGENLLETKIEESNLLNQSDSDLTTIDEKELVIGRLIGSGGFCYVHGVNFRKQKQCRGNINNQQEEHDPFPYAIKRLVPKIHDNASAWIQSILDLYMEIQYLSILHHPHIVSVIATSTTEHSPFYNDGSHMFLICEKLPQTLITRIDRIWKHDIYHNPRKNHANWQKILFDPYGKKEQECFLKRLQHAHGIAQAIQYLHEKRIMYRDIKPDNIGFDSNDVIKLFDFGLIREFDLTQQCTNEVQDDMTYYNYTAMTGSYLYMDPRVAGGLPYNELCDVYSYCILLWQMIELDEPYKRYTVRGMQKYVWESPGGERPNLRMKQWSPELKNMITNGWSFDYSQRPTMTSICDTIQDGLMKSKNHHPHHQVRICGTILETVSDARKSLVKQSQSSSQILRNTHPVRIWMKRSGSDFMPLA